MTEVMGERLELVRDFVNTLDLEEKKDAVATPADLGSWLQVHGLLSETAVTADEHAAALAARETVRRLLLANNGEPADPADLAALDHLAMEAGRAPRFGFGGFRLETRAGGGPGGLGRLRAMVAEAMAEGTRGRLQALSDRRCTSAVLRRR